jgi:hypothetical protein
MYRNTGAPEQWITMRNEKGPVVIPTLPFINSPG